MFRLNLSKLSGVALYGRTTDVYDVVFDNAAFYPVNWSTDREEFKKEHGNKRGYMSGVPFWKLLEILSEIPQ
jgi:hypothetical protein